MATNNSKHTLDEPASADSANAALLMLEQDAGRLKINSIINDYIEKTTFTNKIISITRDTLGHKDTYAVLEPQIKNQVDTILRENGLKQKKFWIPVTISIISVAVAIVAVIVAIIK